ncbi:MAG: histidinol-phosphatase [Bacillota bacterium]|nr:histidinol-phosphatase [Bacillota bacterium]
MKNYHTHTFRCKHAHGDVADYAEAAINKGFSLLGMADHTALPDDRWITMRMSYAELPQYVEAISHAKTRYPELTILKGMECEWTKEYHNFYAQELLGDYEFDYLVLGSHFFPYKGRFLSAHMDVGDGNKLAAYTKHLIDSMESRLFAFVAHPDLFGLTYLNWDKNTIAASRDILQTAAKLQLPLEINGNGLVTRVINTPQGVRTAYPWLKFWELAAEYNVTVVVNSDAHHPEGVDQGMEDGMKIVENLGLELANLDYLNGR